MKHHKTQAKKKQVGDKKKQQETTKKQQENNKKQQQRHQFCHRAKLSFSEAPRPDPAMTVFTKGSEVGLMVW